LPSKKQKTFRKHFESEIDDSGPLSSDRSNSVNDVSYRKLNVAKNTSTKIKKLEIKYL
jgi:hypothetical protein